MVQLIRAFPVLKEKLTPRYIVNSGTQNVYQYWSGGH